MLACGREVGALDDSAMRDVACAFYLDVLSCMLEISSAGLDVEPFLLEDASALQYLTRVPECPVVGVRIL